MEQVLVQATRHVGGREFEFRTSRHFECKTPDKLGGFFAESAVVDSARVIHERR